MPNQTKKDPKGLAIASFVLGLIGLLGGFLILGIQAAFSVLFVIPALRIVSVILALLCIPIPLVGLILGIKGRRSSKRGLAVAGIVLSVVDLLGALVLLLASIVILVLFILDFYGYW